MSLKLGKGIEEVLKNPVQKDKKHEKTDKISEKSQNPTDTEDKDADLKSYLNNLEEEKGDEKTLDVDMLDKLMKRDNELAADEDLQLEQNIIDEHISS